jgi:hypothetical protein
MEGSISPWIGMIQAVFGAFPVSAVWGYTKELKDTLRSGTRSIRSETFFLNETFFLFEIFIYCIVYVIERSG